LVAGQKDEEKEEGQIRTMNGQEPSGKKIGHPGGKKNIGPIVQAGLCWDKNDGNVNEGGFDGARRGVKGGL